MYFDNAATSFPKPETVYRAMDRALREGGGNAGRSGHRGAVEASRTLARARARLAQLINAPEPQRIAWANASQPVIGADGFGCPIR